MTEQLITFLITQVGVSGLFFVLLWFLNKSQSENVKTLIIQQEKREERSYQTLKELIESIQYNSAQIAKMGENINSNQFCPLMRKEYANVLMKEGEKHQ